jgi:hypothetical protein
MKINRLGRKFVTAGLTSLLLSCSGSDKVTGPTQPSRPPVQPPTQPQNHNPIITSSAITQGDEKTIYQYFIQATDPDGDVLNYRKIQGPAWLDVYSNSVQGNKPEVLGDSVFPVTIRVEDGKGGFAEQSYNLTVRNVSNTRVLSTDQLNGISINDSSVIFSQPINFSVGDIVASGRTSQTPNGLIRQITSISSDRKRIVTTQATLEQLSRDASFNYTHELTPQGVSSFSGRGGVSMSPAVSNAFNFGVNFNNVVLYDRDGNTTTTDDQVRLNGNISFNTGFDFNVDVRGFRLNQVKFQQRLTESADLTAGINLLGLASIQNIKIAEYTFSLIVVGVMPPFIPIIVVPKIEVNVGINRSRMNPLSLRVKQDASLTGTLIYNGGWDASVNFSNNFEFSNPVITGDWDFSVYAGPTLKLSLFGISGPSADISARLRVAATNGGDWKLFGGLAASLGASVDILGHNIAAYTREVLSYERILAERGTQTIIDTIQPGPEGKDAFVRHTHWPDGSDTYSGFGDTQLLEFEFDYPASQGVEEETLVAFPLSQIPANKNIASAKLRIYGYATSNYFNNKPTITLSRLLGSWEEASVKWNTKPNSSILSNTDFVNEGTLSWYEFDVTPTVQAWVNGEANYGFGLSTRENSVYGRVYSSDNSDSNKRPMLIVSYNP